MAARVTKLFLQNCAAAKEQTKGSSKRSVANGKPSNSETTRSKNAQRKSRQKSVKVTANKNKERVLDAARRELAQADRTRANLRKLKSKLSAKSQRVAAKALAQRTAAFR
ncbi:hypothetical protein BBJ29_002814 [Phytophthora kernoviae]|uniref:Uncharacterized protein n=1 Tax=Phytophthora kernoviae TaxID=325452 RepID=A0A3F2RPZ5_9STRA|nr:hypothetical protein BBJ29_002814 [Phytophthora kernoviae]RLN61998.1 hypothetical protein BBP00_00005041 [Phytophthora kernoviae]